MENLENKTNEIVQTQKESSKAAQNQLSSEDSPLKDQVSNDLKEKLSEFKDPKKGLKIMSAYMGIHEKTLKRLMDCQNRPGYQTLFKIYRALYNVDSNNEVIAKAPEVISEFLKQSYPDTRNIQAGVSYKINIEEELRKDPIFCEIYFLCVTGEVTKEYIGFQYGSYGLNILDKMLEQKVVVSIRNNVFSIGPRQASLGPESLQRIGIHLTKQFYKPEISDQEGENYTYLLAYGLTKEAYNEWIKIDEEALKKKVELAKDPKNHGSNRAFTFTSTDTLTQRNRDNGILH